MQVQLMEFDERSWANTCWKLGRINIEFDAF